MCELCSAPLWASDWRGEDFLSQPYKVVLQQRSWGLAPTSAAHYWCVDIGTPSLLQPESCCSPSISRVGFPAKSVCLCQLDKNTSFVTVGHTLCSLLSLFCCISFPPEFFSNNSSTIPQTSSFPGVALKDFSPSCMWELFPGLFGVLAALFRGSGGLGDSTWPPAPLQILLLGGCQQCAHAGTMLAWNAGPAQCTN